jgi:hypothetical protein
LEGGGCRPRDASSTSAERREKGQDQLRRERTGVGVIKVSEILDVACTRDGSKEADENPAGHSRLEEGEEEDERNSQGWRR